jgi:hypothetical protein
MREPAINMVVPPVKKVITRFNCFRREDYDNTKNWISAINSFLVPLQEKNYPCNILSFPGEVHINYGDGEVVIDSDNSRCM